MSSPSENQDLQSYLDSLSKEVKDDNSRDSVTEERLNDCDEDDENYNDATEEDNTSADDLYFVDDSDTYQPKRQNRDLTPTSDPINIEELPRRVTRSSKAAATAKISSNKKSYAKLDDTSNVINKTKTLDKEVYEFEDEPKLVGEDSNKKASNVIKILPTSNSTGVVHQCVHCDYTTTKRYILSRHLKGHSDEYFKCSVCEKNFKTNASLVNHMNVHLGKKPYACRFCSMCFTTSGEAVRHVRYRHTKEKPHKCTECDYCSVELSKLRRHMRCHTGERPYQCPHCTYASPDTFKLKRHLRTHTGEKPYECDICQARFTQSNSLKQHRLIHSVGEKPVFQCNLCPTTCGRKNDLRLHIQKLHHSEKPIPCKRCGKELPDRYSYKQHYKTHEGEKCFRCDICPYASVSMLHLDSHMLIHSGEKPFKCDMCDQSFRQRQLLKRHVNLYHTKDYVPPKPREKVHSCPDCGRSFTHQGNLMRHMKTHDPDADNQREKLELKIGRMTRIEVDSTQHSSALDMSDDNGEHEEEDYYEDDEAEFISLHSPNSAAELAYEIIKYEDDSEDVDERKKDKIIFNNAKGNISPIKTNLEQNATTGKEYMAVTVGDGQDYMVVEVIHCEEGEDEGDDENETTDIILNAETVMPMDTKCADLNDCFGFEEESYIEEYDTKETIQLLDIIDDP